MMLELIAADSNQQPTDLFAGVVLKARYFGPPEYIIGEENLFRALAAQDAGGGAGAGTASANPAKLLAFQNLTIGRVSVFCRANGQHQTNVFVEFDRIEEFTPTLAAALLSLPLEWGFGRP
jgi:hypothetical protein